MNVNWDSSLLRPVSALGILGLLLALEWLIPFRVPAQSKLRHVATNLIIGGSNAVVVNLLFGWALLLLSLRAEAEGWGLLHQIGAGSVANLITSVVLLDLIFYGVHWANHHAPFLWRFHRAHHSDLDLDVTTALRFHIGEVLISTAIKAVCVAVLGISPIGLIVFEATLLAAAQFQHSNLQLPESMEIWLRFLVITPHIHWIHHSRRPQEHNTNFGTILSGWDRLFRTYSMGVYREEIRIGLDQYPSPEHVGLGRFYTIPFGPGCPIPPMIS